MVPTKVSEQLVQLSVPARLFAKLSMWTALPVLPKQRYIWFEKACVHPRRLLFCYLFYYVRAPCSEVHAWQLVTAHAHTWS